MKLDDGFGFGIIRLYLTLTTGIFRTLCITYSSGGFLMLMVQRHSFTGVSDAYA